MSYPIIFQTIIVRLSDGRILHLDRSGCNNDTEGRNPYSFTASICTKEDYIERANSFMEGSAPYRSGGNFELKIGNRSASYYDYGKHLLRALSCAKKYNAFLAERNTVFADYCCGIKFITPDGEKIVSTDEFQDEYHRLLDAYPEPESVVYQRMMCRPNINNEEAIVQLLGEGKTLEFFVGKKKI